MNLQDFDYYMIGLSGGKDSTATFLWLVYESGLPTHKIRAVCCDTDNEDPITNAYLAMLSELTNIPIHYLTPKFKGEDTGFYDLAISKGTFPARRSQFCTDYLKVRTLQAYTFDLCQKGKVLSISGVRKAEGKHVSN
jgi:3'-phosphoadenosine 5'-phosphosulfate sulfotransferase (PAPS reductase)/FAD synthetase